ncbi:MAG: enoyl-CoA hydratase/isomerase family protein [Proteobacteria bacterium]|nr:enoyl-CoA hydratase/isomerase family protein [Pseudomonadota bacterium]
MSFETMVLEKRGGVAVLTLNRPERLNAINMKMVDEFEAILKEIDEDDTVRTVILTGAGRGFCAGADIKEMADPQARQLPVGRAHPFFFQIENLGKIVIAAVNGPCNGGGLEIALCCDFRIASEAASFGLGEVKLGVIPAGGGTARLPRLIGIARAKKFLYFGDRVDAKGALEIGLVDEVAPPEGLMEAAGRWAAELAERPPLSLRMLKACANQGMQMDLVSACDYEAKCAAFLQKTEDRQEGVQAFVEKRGPVFRGR